VVFFLGLWLMFGPQEKNMEIWTGAFVCLIAVFAFHKPKTWKNWVVCLTGVWLLLAPLLFWTRDPAVFGNDTLVGLLLMLFSVVFIRPSPSGPEIPEGWSYNPSTWAHRAPVIFLGFIGFFLARMMASFQLGHTSAIWDPFFSGGTEKVLTSQVAKSFPISDAGLGSVAYVLEAVSGLIGDTRRWRTMPWMVYLFFVLVVPAGVVSIVLIMLQPVVVGAWCTLCLITALLTLLTLPPAIDEVFATTQFLIAAKSRWRSSLWKFFWLGDRTLTGRPAFRESSEEHSLWHYLREGMNGIGFPWNLFLSMLLGLGLILWPLTKSDYVAGTVVVTFAVVATAEPTRALRFINIAVGLWAIVTPLLLPDAAMILKTVHVGAGILLCALSCPRGKIRERYGIFQRFIV
jgi:uncharacterized membrane protein